MKRQTVTALTDAYTLVRVVFDRRAPNRGAALLILLLTAAYVVSPVDILSDLVPVVGWSDDVAAGLIGRHAIYRLTPPEIVDDHREAASSHLLAAVGLTLAVVAVFGVLVLHSLGVV